MLQGLRLVVHVMRTRDAAAPGALMPTMQSLAFLAVYDVANLPASRVFTSVAAVTIGLSTCGSADWRADFNTQYEGCVVVAFICCQNPAVPRFFGVNLCPDLRRWL